MSSDRLQGGLQATVTIDRMTAARLGVAISAIDNALNNAFAQRQVATIYGVRNQYKIILEIDPRFQRELDDLGRIFVPSANGAEVPLTNLVKIERGLSPLAINHTGVFPSVTITYNLGAGEKIDVAASGIKQAIAELRLPATVTAEAAGDAKAFAANASAQPLLIE